MGLSCGCDFEWDGESEMYWHPTSYTVMKWSSRRKKCKSCSKTIKAGSLVGEFDRMRGPKNDIEFRIYGDEIYLTPFYLCESCVDIFFNLEDLGFCVDPYGNMANSLNEYKRDYIDK